MQLKHGLGVTFLTFGLSVILGSGCSDSSDNDKGKVDEYRRENDALAAQNSALQNELAEEQAKNKALADAPLKLQDLESEIASLKVDNLDREAVLEAQKAEIELLQASGDAGAEAKIKELADLIKLGESQIAEQKVLLSRLEIAASEKSEDLARLYKATITPYEGIWIMDPKPELAFSNCQYMVRFDADEGRAYRAAICDDGKIQAEVQNVSTFFANNSAGWSGSVGFGMNAVVGKSSCGEGSSILLSGDSYGFDHSVGTATIATEASLFMTSKLGPESKTFKSGSAIPDLGKNKSCSTIVNRSKLPSQAGNILLQEAAKVCQLTKDLVGTGCFKANDLFEPSL